MKTYDLEKFRQRLLDLNYSPQKIAFEDEFALFEDISEINIATEPTRFNMAVFGLCLEGEVDVSVDMKTWHLRRNSYFVLLPNQVVSLPQQMNNLHGIFICLNSKIYNELVQRMQEMLPLFFFIRQNPCATLNESDVEWIANYHQQIFKEIRQTENLFHRETAQALMVALLYKICNIYSGKLINQKQIHNRQEEIFTKFLQLVSRYFREHREVTFYADKMCITPKYLSTMIKRVSGQSANEWIQSYVIQEAKLLLKTTHKTIQEISVELHFPSQSFFGKYFKHNTGVSPQQFRKLPTQTP